MKSILSALLIIVLLFSSNFLSAQSKKQKPLVLDLAEIDPGQKKSVPGNKSYDYIIIKNNIINKGYSIKISKESQPIDPLPPPDLSGSSSIKITEVDSCNLLNRTYLRLAELFNPDNTNEIIKTEKEVSLRADSLQQELNRKNCTDPKLIGDAQELIRKCQSQRKINESINIEEGDIVTIIVSRDDKIWTWEFVGEPIGKWVLSYGFGFCSSALEARTYHIKQLNDTSFQIQKSKKPGVLDLSYIPSIFYSFLPASRYKSNFNWSITAGLGFDLSAPVVFFGGGFMFHQNIGINVGLALQQQSRLKPQYSENEILKVSLEKDQLHDKIYRPNAFISINFRFSENPFKSSSKEKTN